LSTPETIELQGPLTQRDVPRRQKRIPRPSSGRAGGAKGSGAPKGNADALKHGLPTRAARDERKALSELVRRARKLAQSID